MQTPIQKGETDGFLEQQKNKPKDFRNFIKGIGRNSHKLPMSLQTADGTVVKEAGEVLEAWKDYFCKLLNPSLGNGRQTNVHPIDSLPLDTSELNEIISFEEVRRAVFANEDTKSPGFDQIKPVFIKNEAVFTSYIPSLTIASSIGSFQMHGSKLSSSQIPKTSSNSQCPSDYRGISLQSFVAKTYCRILNHRLREWLEANDALSDEQNGFRSDRSCQDHIFTLTSIVENRMGRKEDTFTCFIDFKKAFDCVNRDVLWEKLAIRFGLSGHFLLAIKALYEDVLCSVNVNQTLTDWFCVNNGVKQGCILSPTLFVMFIDDLVQDINLAQLGVNCQTCTLSTL